MSNNALGNLDCPSLMSDGRLFTDYRPSCYIHDLVLKQNGITNSFDLKELMVSRGNKLQEINRQFAESKASCKSCGGYYLPDPNGHVDYWKQYDEWIGYGSLLNAPSECPIMKPKPKPEPKSKTKQ